MDTSTSSVEDWLVMEHEIKELEWNDYFDGTASEQLTTRIESHIVACLECWQFHQEMTCAIQILNGACEEARRALAIDDQQIKTELQKVRSRLRSTDKRRSQVQGRLNLLETVLAPYFGAGATERAFHVAAKNSPARSLEQVTTDNWEPFMERLTAIAAAMCGETFAGLVWERGQF
jgi:hypothetical protein